MKNPLRTAIRYAATAAAIAVTATGAMAQSYNATTAGGPTFNRQLEGLTPGTCSGSLSGVGTAVRFHVQPVWAASAGLRTFTSVATAPAGWDNYLFLYSAAWNPATPLVGCLAASDDNPGIGQSQFGFNMLANTQYFIVTTGFDNADAGAFTNTVTGGPVTFGLINQNVIPEPSTYALMATGLVGLAGMARRRRSTQV
jgi:hypothetical protein